MRSKYQRRGCLTVIKYGNKILRKYLSLCTCNFPISDHVSLSHKVNCDKLKLCYDVEKNPGPYFATRIDTQKQTQQHWKWTNWALLFLHPLIATSEPWKKTNLLSPLNSFISFTNYSDKIRFLHHYKKCHNVPWYSLFVTPKFWINRILFRSSLSLSKILEWPTKSIIVWYLISSSCQILHVNNSFRTHDAEVYASTAFSCIETFTCNRTFYESENFSDFSLDHIFESGNKRFSFSTKIS